MASPPPGSAVLAHRRELVGDRADVGGPAVGERQHRAREVLGVLRFVAAADPRTGDGAGRAEDVERVLGGQRRHVNHFEARRAIAQQPQRARDVAAREHEPVAARGQAVDAVVEHAPQPGKALERAQLEELVEEERGRLARRRARTAEEGQRSVERGARAAAARPRRPADSLERAIPTSQRAGSVRAWSPCVRRRCAAPTCGRFVREAAGAAWSVRCRSRQGAPGYVTVTRRAPRSRARARAVRGVSIHLPHASGFGHLPVGPSQSPHG